MTNSFLMQAVMTTLNGLPAASRRWAKAQQTGLLRPLHRKIRLQQQVQGRFDGEANGARDQFPGTDDRDWRLRRSLLILFSFFSVSLCLRGEFNFPH